MGNSNSEWKKELYDFEKSHLQMLKKVLRDDDWEVAEVGNAIRVLSKNQNRNCEASLVPVYVAIQLMQHVLDLLPFEIVVLRFEPILVGWWIDLGIGHMKHAHTMETLNDQWNIALKDYTKANDYVLNALSCVKEWVKTHSGITDIEKLRKSVDNVDSHICRSNGEVNSLLVIREEVMEEMEEHAKLNEDNIKEPEQNMLESDPKSRFYSVLTILREASYCVRITDTSFRVWVPIDRGSDMTIYDSVFKSMQKLRILTRQLPFKIRIWECKIIDDIVVIGIGAKEDNNEECIKRTRCDLGDNFADKARKICPDFKINDHIKGF